MRRKKRKPKMTWGLGSLSFFLAIPVTFLLGSLFFITLVIDIERNGLFRDRWLLFVSGAIVGISLLSIVSLSWLRVFIHEVKHGIVVLLSGNVLKDIEVRDERGHVEYAMYKTRDHFEPHIVLAPYFFPLLSLPTFVATIFAGQSHGELMAAILGLTFAIDTVTAWGELYPHQSDLQRVAGGFFVAALFIAGAQYLWSACCLLWVQTEFSGFFKAAGLVVQRAFIGLAG